MGRGYVSAQGGDSGADAATAARECHPPRHRVAAGGRHGARAVAGNERAHPHRSDKPATGGARAHRARRARSVARGHPPATTRPVRRRGAAAYAGRDWALHCDRGAAASGRRRMRILIVDDEKLARERLRELIADIGGYTVVGQAANGAEAGGMTAEFNPDVLLMDIRMPGMDGLEAAMHLMGMEHPPSVILTTAYDQHALDAFEVNAVDYLLKPIRKDRLAHALAKARKLTMKQLKEGNQARAEAPARTHLSVHMRGNIRLVPVPDIMYFVADSKYMMSGTPAEEHLVEDSLIHLEQEYGGRFLRVHRNALVATAFIKGIEKSPAGTWQVNLRGTDKKLEVSRRHTAGVRRWARN